jgi:ribosomal protein L11 methyltransferase
MHYTEFNIEITPYSQQNADILTALLADLGFDSFIDSPKGLIAYIPTKLYSEGEIKLFLKNIPFGIEVNYSITSIEDQNWNKQWESNFEPITVENFCRVRAPFHSSEKNCQLEITIEPKMAFGTGHHQTTWLMIRELFNTYLKDKTVLDMGCGTGILAIVAEKLGASSITAIDNDKWANENTLENIKVNGCSKIKALHGDASILGNEMFDIILANINLNILIKDIHIYSSSLNNGGLLVMSGILVSDIDTISLAAISNGLSILDTRYKNDWAMVLSKKL